MCIVRSTNPEYLGWKLQVDVRGVTFRTKLVNRAGWNRRTTEEPKIEGTEELNNGNNNGNRNFSFNFNFNYDSDSASVLNGVLACEPPALQLLPRVAFLLPFGRRRSS